LYSGEVYGELPYILLTCTAYDRTLVWENKGGIMAPVQSHRSRKEERLEARVTPAQKRLIERAAALRGTSVTEFVVVSAQEAAASAIKEFEVLILRDEAREVFLNAILRPANPNKAARIAAKRYKKDMGV
jgi:uncharacterized protein (DUF1778 family)